MNVHHVTHEIGTNSSEGPLSHSEPSDSGMEPLLALRLRFKEVTGQATTPAPALLVFMLATIVQELDLGQYISAVLRYVLPSWPPIANR